jgi:hypothetical protein
MAAANEYKANLSPNFTLADTYNAEYIDTTRMTLKTWNG